MSGFLSKRSTSLASRFHHRCCKSSLIFIGRKVKVVQATVIFAKIFSMLQVNVLRQRTNWVKERLAIKNFKQLELVDEIVALDNERKKLQTEFDATQAKINGASKEIGKLMGQGKKDEAEAKKSEVAGYKLQTNSLNEKMSVIEKSLHDQLVQLPNLPGEKVPPGTTPEENVVVRSGGEEPILSANAIPHWELITKYDLVDFETGVKITGRGFPLYKGKGAKLQRALIQYFLDYNTAAGY